MTAPDPDAEPTRHGGDTPSREDSTMPADRTVPAGKAPRGTPPPSPPIDRTAQVPAPPPAGGRSSDPLMGKVLGGCRIDKLLGRGAMGAVYKARQEKLDRDVAIKVIRPEMMTDPRMLKRFEVEARTVGKFNSAHVVMVHDVGFELGVHYLVMEFVQGKNLRDHVKLLAGGRLPVGEALPLLRQAIKGLEEAQRLRVIHRDIKPDNLMITDRGVLKIADFGIAKPMQEDFSMTLTSELVGTPLYMSPEQCQGQAELDFRSDMYSLGATFYYLLTGEPPIRASSVYELIQTKTKLAHLCLWKALPGLEENNPLSRVIERMTALDREDRYESYEALLNDLVLVEHGQTVQVQKAGGPAGKGKAQPASRRGRWLAAALLLVVGGGGAAYALQPPAVDSQKLIADQLKNLRARLATEGPSDALTGELGKVAPPKELTGEHGKLAKEVEQARALRTALAGIQTPKKVPPPFDAVRGHFAAVDQAVKAHPVAGAEATKWRDRAVAVARDEVALGKAAIAELQQAFTQWTDKRARIAGDVTRLAEARAELDQIEAARQALLTLVPAVGEDLDRLLAKRTLDDAKRELADTKVGPVVVDVAEPLANFRDELLSKGPTADLGGRIQKLQPTKAEQIQAHGQLVNDFDVANLASKIATEAGIKKPKDPQPPFKDVKDYWDTIDGAFERVRIDGKLPPWAEAQRRELRAETELRPKVVAACGTAFAQWQRGGVGDAVQTAALRDTRTRAAELFADAAAAIEQAIPEAQLTAAVAAAATAQQLQRWTADADKLDKRLGALTSLADWAAAAKSVGETFDALKTAAGPFAGDADVAREQARLAEAMQRWRTAAERMQEIDGKLAEAAVKPALPLATAGASGTEGKSEFLLALDAITAIESAFDGLQKTLDVEVALTTLRSAREKLRGRSCLAATEGRLARWCEALQKLQAAAAGMIPIPAGVPKGGGARVDAFFLAAAECSRADFVQFLTELRAAVAGIADPQQAFAAVAPRFAGSGMTADRLRGLLDRTDKADRLPIDNLTWFTAAACAAWQGRALPTAEEWALAAFGDAGVQKFPWGGTWSNESSKRNAGTSAVEVDAGGLSWRSQGDRRLHHLAGNVAEWLASDASKPEAQLAGGRFNDSSARVSEERSSGALEMAAKDDGRRGYGFRTVLRLRGFLGLDWPR